jgi:thioredoxin 1
MEITTEELKQKINNGEKLIIDFWGTWCGPCRIMKPTFDKLSNQYREENSEIQLYTMDVDKNRDIAVEYGVRAIPTIKVFNKGEVVETRTGIQQEPQLNDLVNSLK